LGAENYYDKKKMNLISNILSMECNIWIQRI
jgi:hypothetical protein